MRAMVQSRWDELTNIRQLLRVSRAVSDNHLWPPSNDRKS